MANDNCKEALALAASAARVLDPSWQKMSIIILQSCQNHTRHVVVAKKKQHEILSQVAAIITAGKQRIKTETKLGVVASTVADKNKSSIAQTS
jgi:hypothetical protein